MSARVEVQVDHHVRHFDFKATATAAAVAKGVRLIGPNHRARADAVRQLPGCSSRTHLLQQLMAVQLMADVAATWKVREVVLSVSWKKGDAVMAVIHFVATREVKCCDAGG
eukprot:1141309-Pelagomonas_calceolata.AAC.2